MKNRYLATTLALAATIAAVASPVAQAFPPFTEKEGKPCGYCHVNATGGGKRNYRGVYYKMNSLTFASFDDAAEAKKAGVEIGPEATPPAKSYTPPKTADGEVKPNAPADTEKPEKLAPKVAASVANATKAKAAWGKNKKSVPLRKSYAAALTTLGNAYMNDQTTPAKTRYYGALRAFSEALELDPTNRDAAAKRKMIQDVYKQMGLPIPKFPPVK